jgi:hypothetical protein
VNLYNEKFAKPAQSLMKLLEERGKISPSPFDDKIEWTFYYLWHHEGRRARMGASMMGPDYTQWHGFFEVAERFYMELLPEAIEIADGDKELLDHIEALKSAADHKWTKGLSAEEKQRIKDFYRAKYGQ